MPHADQLIINIGRLATGSQAPLRGHNLAQLSCIDQAAIAVQAGKIVALGSQAELSAWTADQVIDAQGYLAIPGFVDPHTHACYAGDRAHEFELRIKGASYSELMAAGGGIMSTVRATRAASKAELIAQTRPRLDQLLAHGTTTVEIKTGYGLDTATELTMLEAIAELAQTHPIGIVPTFMGAHAIPSEYRDDPEAFVSLVVEEMLPAVAAWWQQQSIWQEALACDIFCENGAFSVAQSQRILLKAKALGFRLKLHVDEFEPLGGTPLAVELGAISVDHLVATPPEHIAILANSETVGVSLPGTPFGLGKSQFSPARSLIEANGILALATDCNPGTSPCESMPMAMAIGCRYLRLTPAEALNAATVNSAFAIRQHERVGSLAVGMQADIALLNLPDERHIGYKFGTNPVAIVIKAGRVVHQNQLHADH